MITKLAGETERKRDYTAKPMMKDHTPLLGPHFLKRFPSYFYANEIVTQDRLSFKIIFD